MSNENNSIIARQAKEKLVEVYATGIFGYCAIEEGSPIKIPNYPDFDSFFRVLVEAELLYSGMLDQMSVDWYMDDAEKEELREGMTRVANN